MMSLEPHCYQPLDLNQIRVLTLHHHANGDCAGSMKHISLKSRFLSKHSKYVALSYTWGEEMETHRFICDGQVLPIRANLRSALQRLSRLLGNTFIWIDALCINQSNWEEKFAQIQIMPDIYKRAKRVLIWLGEETEVIKSTIWQLPDIVSRFKACTSGTTQNYMPSPDCVLGIRELLTRPWWCRLWVLQEATLARAATFICGSHQIEWNLLKDLVHQVQKNSLVGKFRGSTRRVEYCDGFTELGNIESIRHTHSIYFVPNLLRVCRQRICSDPRDRVHAVVGLMPAHMREGYTWDPRDNVVDLYTQFAASMLQWDIFGHILSLNETTKRLPDLPTWVPDFHQRAEVAILADSETYHAGYNTHTSTTPFVIDLESQPQVKVVGQLVDRVVLVLDGTWNDPLTVYTTDGLRSGLLAETLLNVAWLEACVVAYANRDCGEDSAHASAETALDKCSDLWRVFIGELVGNETSRLHWLSGFGSIHDSLVQRRWKSENSNLTQAFNELLLYLRRLTTDLSSALHSERRNTMSREFANHVPPRSSVLYHYLRRMGRICTGRKFIVTDNGRAGLAPLRVQDGDEICILKGTNVPFVLRSVSTIGDTHERANVGKFNLIGEAYVQGLMHGKCVARPQKTKFEELVIV